MIALSKVEKGAFFHPAKKVPQTSNPPGSTFFHYIKFRLPRFCVRKISSKSIEGIHEIHTNIYFQLL
jgi:hypothetical protein